MPEEKHQVYCESIARDAQRGEWTSLLISSFFLNENFEENISTITYDFSFNDEVPTHVTGTGLGIIDALFNSLGTHLSGRFSSLSQLEFRDFSVKVNFNHTRRPSKTDASVEVCLVISTSPFYETYFRHKSTSLVSASVEAVRKSIEYFINLEQAFFILRENVELARVRDREDLIIENSNKIVEIVKIISFEEVLK